MRTSFSMLRAKMTQFMRRVCSPMLVIGGLIFTIAWIVLLGFELITLLGFAS